MARMEPLRIDDVDPDLRHVCEDAERQSGTSVSTRTYAKNPVVMKALTQLRATLAKEGSIDPVLRELIRLKVASLNGCRY
jgi:alkylhydroperoxidase family enzyme